MLTVRQTIEGVDVDRIFSPFAPHIVKVEEVIEKKTA
jgi:ribosomal protein L19